MSGLEKFQGNESWRTNIKKFLFIERKPTPQTVVTFKETQRCSLDIEPDLQSLLRERKKQIEVAKEQTPQCKEAAFESEVMDDKMNDTRFALSSDLPMGEMVSDESFEALEKMCDKTASDPDSTLFLYLNSEKQEQVLAEVKKRNSGRAAAESLAENEGASTDILVDKLNDCTMLDEIEAPSRIWDNTIVTEGPARTSPVKMVGLLRPSTIMEEAADESASSEFSSLLSFQTATKGCPSEVSSSYDTAHESTARSSHADSSHWSRTERENIDVDHILEAAIERSRQINSAEPLLLGRSMDGHCCNDQLPDKDNNSGDLIDLETTCIGDVVVIEDDNDAKLDELTEDNYSANEEELGEELEDEYGEESIINILSDDDEETDSHNKQAEPRYCDIKSEKLSFTSQGYKDDSSHFDDNTFDADKENLVSVNTSGNESMKFNDTMEEVEYMLKKGLEYMAAREQQIQKEAEAACIVKVLSENAAGPIENRAKAAFTPKTCTTNSAEKKSRTKMDSPMSHKKLAAPIINSASKAFKSPAKSTLKPSNRSQIDMRPFPKFELFGGKSPRTPAAHPRPKELATKQAFSHIVSPVGAYMHKTASAPLMAKGKMSSNANALNSRAFRELEYEARLCQPQVGTGSSNSDSLPPLNCLKGAATSLPKKAYISSELKHIVDERTPFTIPGGKSVQKYLESAMMPAVLRHDGKMKFPGAPNVPSSTNSSSNPPQSTSAGRRNNASLADLSLMSGDVSMYTIMDAQKF